MPHPASSAYPGQLPPHFSRLTFLEQIVSRWETRKLNARRRRKPLSVKITPLRAGGVRPLAKDDIPLIFLAHDDMRFMRSLLAHYRGLGVTRFLCVDDRSTDGTREFLLGEPDVDVFESEVRYRDAKRGRLWREALVALHGFDRWYLNVDSDEYLFYEDCETRPLPDLFAALEGQGLERFPAPMLDAYPAEAASAAGFDGGDSRMPWQVAGWFDGSGYRVTKQRRGLSVRGGMRERMFGGELELVKYPVLFWRKGYILGSTIHQPMPFQVNFAPILGVLLHFKFFNDVEAMARAAVEDGQYYAGAREYRRILEQVEGKAQLDFLAPVSRRFEGSRDLVGLGFMEPVFSRACA